MAKIKLLIALALIALVVLFTSGCCDSCDCCGGDDEDEDKVTVDGEETAGVTATNGFEAESVNLIYF